MKQVPKNTRPERLTLLTDEEWNEMTINASVRIPRSWHRKLHQNGKSFTSLMLAALAREIRTLEAKEKRKKRAA